MVIYDYICIVIVNLLKILKLIIMKKLLFVSAVVIITTTLFSCEKGSDYTPSPSPTPTGGGDLTQATRITTTSSANATATVNAGTVNLFSSNIIAGNDYFPHLASTLYFFDRTTGAQIDSVNYSANTAGTVAASAIASFPDIMHYFYTPTNVNGVQHLNIDSYLYYTIPNSLKGKSVNYRLSLRRSNGTILVSSSVLNAFTVRP